MKKKELIRNYLRGNASYKEEKELQQWIKEDKGNEQLFANEKANWEEDRKQDKQYSISLDQKWEHFKTRSNIHEAVSEKQRPIISLNIFLRYAASIIILIGSFTVIRYLVINSNEKIPDYVFENVKPSSTESSYIILADGEKLELESHDAHVEYNDKGTEILLNKDSIVTQNTLAPKKNTKEIVYNQMLVPYGKTAQIILSDGTKVWLNAGTKLVYPPSFQADKREVFLVGEAFFEVTENPDRPFIVKTKELNVKVLGTSFNVKTYPDDNNIETTLASGKVMLEKNENKNKHGKEIILRPGQMANYSKEYKTIKVKNVEIESYISWKDGWYKLEGLALSELAKKLERYYDIQIDILPKDLQILKITGKLELKESIERVMENISVTAAFNYTIENNQVSIY